MEILKTIIKKFDLPDKFSNECINQTKKLSNKILVKDLKNRIDLRSLDFITIDGEDAKDFDDAVYCEEIKIKRTNYYKLFVAIADVSHYVKSNDEIDKDALDRATSIYFPQAVIPMLPEKLSNDLCSLKPNIDRLVLNCEILVNRKGELKKYKFYPAIIKSRNRCTYNQIFEIIKTIKNKKQNNEINEKNEKNKNIFVLYSAFKSLLKARINRGALDFETVETKVIYDKDNKIEKIQPLIRNDAHKLIEEFMLIANVCAADFVFKSENQDCLFRVHEKPSIEKLIVLQKYLNSLAIKNNINLEDIKPKQLQIIANETKKREDALIIHNMLLRSQMQAKYTPNNLGHFGLALPLYTHFTSPIRRYPDLLVHRTIKAILENKKYKLIKSQSWEDLGNHCSDNERRAEEAEREVLNYLKCEYMKQHLGEIFNGTISTVTNFGLFVSLDNLYIEGLVHVTQLGNDYFYFDEVKQELCGKKTGIVFNVGKKITVQVANVDLEKYLIDFVLINEENEKSKKNRKTDKKIITKSKLKINKSKLNKDFEKTKKDKKKSKLKIKSKTNKKDIKAKKSRKTKNKKET